MNDDGIVRRRRPNLRRASAVAVAVLLLVGALAATAYAVERVRATGDSVFRPRKTNASVGERVVWRSTGGTHTVTAYRGDWSKDSTISDGERTSFTFADAGRYRYRCRFHSTLSDGRCSGMCGVVIVG